MLKQQLQNGTNVPMFANNSNLYGENHKNNNNKDQINRNNGDNNEKNIIN